MKSIRIVTAALCAVGLSLGMSIASAQQAPASKPLLISTGGPSGTYYRLIEEIKPVCPDVALEQWQSDDKKPSTGSLMNIDNILGNKAELGIVQSDALELRAQKEDDIKKRIFTLIMLHPEEVHVITKSQPHKEGGYGVGGFTVGGKMVVYNNVAELRGHKVGYWGGSSVTVQMVNIVGMIGFEAVEFNDQSAALDGLQADNIDAILAVGGQPLGWVEKLSRDYKVLEFSDSLVKQLSSVYDKTTLTYRNLGQDGVQTVSVNALLVTRNYTSPVAIKKLAALRQCVIDHIDDIRDTRDTHPKWQVIDPTKESRWQMFKPAMTAPKG